VEPEIFTEIEKVAAILSMLSDVPLAQIQIFNGAFVSDLVFSQSYSKFGVFSVCTKTSPWSLTAYP
jgi:hypothetical protein